MPAAARNAGSLLAPYFSVVAVIPKDNVSVTANGDKIKIVNEAATILRHACKDCGAHLYGRIEKDHAFKGLDFVHVELSMRRAGKSLNSRDSCPPLRSKDSPRTSWMRSARNSGCWLGVLRCLEPASHAGSCRLLRQEGLAIKASL